MKNKNTKSKLGSWCKSCKNTGNRRWHAANREKANETSRQWRMNNLEKARERSCRWHAANREKANERSRRWYIANFEESRGKRRRWHAANREKVNERSRQWRMNNPEKARERERRWRMNNLDRVRAKARRTLAVRRAREHAAPGSFTAADVRAQYAKQSGMCYYCGCALDGQYHIDHYIPLARGGTNYPDNLVCACAFCNLSKGDSLPTEWTSPKQRVVRILTPDPDEKVIRILTPEPDEEVIRILTPEPAEDDDIPDD